MTVTMTGPTGPRVCTDDGAAGPWRRQMFRSIDSDQLSPRCGPRVRTPGADARWAHGPWEWDVMLDRVSRSTPSRFFEASS
jgi:hypothetical protein